MTRLLRPNVILPAIMGVTVLAGLLAFSNVGAVAATMATFRLRYVAYVVLFLLAYEAVRLGQWHFMLRALGVDVPLRTQVFTFISGEAAKDLPAGNFVPDYLLQTTTGTDFGLVSAATVLITLIEVGVSLVVMACVGIAGWDWLRPLILSGTAVFALLASSFGLWLRSTHGHRGATWEWMTRWLVTRRALAELRQFVRGEVQLMRPRVLVVASALGAMYLTLGGAGLYMVARGLGIERLGFWQVVAVYCFSVAFAAIVPLPMDFGSIEASGTGALVAAGVLQSAAVGLILLNRVLSVVLTLLVASVVWVVLRKDVRTALQGRPTPLPSVRLAASERNENRDRAALEVGDACAA
jgi:uncharacterized membrane protein YbhN (UPF0104 family)